MTFQNTTRSSRLRNRCGPAAVVTGSEFGYREQFARQLAATDAHQWLVLVTLEDE